MNQIIVQTAELDALGTLALQVVKELRAARETWVQAVMHEAKLKRAEVVTRAGVERCVIEGTEGGEKAIGSNEAARTRAFTLALDVDASYQAVIKCHDDACETAMLAEANVRSLQDELGVLRAAMARDGKQE